jgi:uncharacterized protein YjbI with pentapeptide repeats
MPRRIRAARTGLQPPQIPQRLAPASDVEQLADGGAFCQVILEAADFTGQTADDVLFEQVNGKKVRLDQTHLTLAQLLDVRLETCDLAAIAWVKAHLQRVALVGSRLLGATFTDCELADVLFEQSNLELARFWGSTLRSVHFERCLLRQASFEGVDLSGVVFRDCDLTEADLRGARMLGTDLRGSTLSGVQVNPQDLRGAIIDPTQTIHLAALLGIVVREQEPARA